MINSKDLEKAIVEGIKAIAYSGVEKPDTPDIDRIEEVNNPEKEGKVIATSIKVEMTPFQPRLRNDKFFLNGDKVEVWDFK
tara:strand:- start:47 stop:289 length:243 start_codon:yes stop_codon:yes gene_type:complete